MKYMNRKRTNVINPLQIHQDLRAFPASELAHNGLVGGSSLRLAINALTRWDNSVRCAQSLVNINVAVDAANRAPNPATFYLPTPACISHSFRQNGILVACQSANEWKICRNDP